MGSLDRAALYVRVSDRYAKDAAERGQETSLDTQLAACRQHAVALGCTVDEAHVYREKWTGTELWGRQALTRLREAIRRREVDVVVAFAIDRLSRDPVHLGVVLSEAEQHQARVVFVTEPLDDSPEGQLVRFVRGYAAKVEHEKIRERVMRGRFASARAGKLQHGSRPRYGYRWRDGAAGVYDEDPITGPIVRGLFAKALNGGTLRAMAHDLTTAGVPSPGGRSAWDFSTIGRLLRDPVYAGEAVAFRTQRLPRDHRLDKTGRPLKHGRTVARSEEERIPLPAGTVPPLVDRATFDAVQDQLPRNKRESRRSAIDPEAHLLRGGYVHCGHCGRVMVVNHKKGYAVYVCTTAKRFPGQCGFHAISTRLLDELVWAKVWTTLRHPERVRDEAARRRAIGDPTTDADLAAVDGSLAEVERDRRRQARLLALLDDLDDERTIGEIKGRLAALAQRKQQLEDERAGVLVRRADWEAELARLDNLVACCEMVNGNLTSLGYADKRDALLYLNVQATVWRGDHSPRWRVTGDPNLSAEGRLLRPTACTPHTTAPLLVWTDLDDWSIAAD
jgi:site-specific DNA recombinase